MRIMVCLPADDPLNASNSPSVATDEEGWEVLVPPLSGLYAPDWGEDLAALQHYKAKRVLAMTAAYGRFVVAKTLKPSTHFFLLPPPVILRILQGELSEGDLLKALLAKGLADGPQ